MDYSSFFQKAIRFMCIAEVVTCTDVPTKNMRFHSFNIEASLRKALRARGATTGGEGPGPPLGPEKTLYFQGFFR